jgi:hypothetical protein
MNIKFIFKFNIILIFLNFGFGEIYATIFSLKNGSQNIIKLTIGAINNNAPVKLVSDEIKPGQTYRFSPDCVTNLVWYTKETYEREIDLGFNLGKKKIKARLGNMQEFKEKKCANTNWTVDNDLKLN